MTEKVNQTNGPELELETQALSVLDTLQDLKDEPRMH
jgi:hypothetical protein